MALWEEEAGVDGAEAWQMQKDEAETWQKAYEPF